MKTKLSFFLTAFCMLSISGIFAQGGSCNTAAQICLASPKVFPTCTDVESLGQYGCLATTPNPTWFALKVAQSGRINIGITSSGDVDCACWGPFSANQIADLYASSACSDLLLDCSGCPSHANPAEPNTNDLGGYPLGNLVDCSFSTSATEYVRIPNANTNEWYLIFISSYSNMSGDISVFGDTSSVGTSNCDFCAGIEEVASLNITLSPNPVSDAFTCTFETIKNRELALRDIQGKVILSWNSSLQKEVIDTKQLSNGIYFLNVTENNHTFTSKFVINRN